MHAESLIFASCPQRKNTPGQWLRQRLHGSVIQGPWGSGSVSCSVVARLDSESPIGLHPTCAETRHCVSNVPIVMSTSIPEERNYSKQDPVGTNTLPAEGRCQSGSTLGGSTWFLIGLIARQNYNSTKSMCPGLYSHGCCCNAPH